jgi:hypothetical protein
MGFNSGFKGLNKLISRVISVRVPSTSVTKAKYNHFVVETVLLLKYYSGAQISELGGPGSTYGGEESAGFWWVNLRETHLEDEGVDGTIILK